MAIVVMTGGTSGFGVRTAEHLSGAGCRLILGARRPPAELLPLDLTSLDSVRTFADAVGRQLGSARIVALVLNAGIIRPDAAGRSADGFETTFAVNHLAHYLLARLLLGRLSDGGRIVMTTSGTHDPATRAELVPPRHADADLLAHPERDPDLDPTPAKAGQHAYTASKTCVVLTARALAENQAVRERGIRVVAYCPGQVFGTGLAAGLSRPRRVAWAVMGTPVSAPLRRFVPTLNTQAAAGGTLARLALGSVALPEGGSYTALRRGRLTWPEPSELARDDETGAALWRASAKLVGLTA